MAKTVSLAALPAGDDLEDYVAALFQAAGYFVEKNLVERDPSDILELDTRLSRLCGGEGPGLLDFQDFFGCGWSGGCGGEIGLR